MLAKEFAYNKKRGTFESQVNVTSNKIRIGTQPKSVKFLLLLPIR